jgi:UDP-glucose 4-epimerase
MNILVTGGAGFIGKKLVNKLSKDYTVFTIDKSKIDSNNHFTLDISEPNFIDNIPKLKIDHIYHIAAQSGGYYSLKDPYIDCKWNCLGTVNIVKLAQKLNVKKITYISSMAVYGNQAHANEDSKVDPISFYGVSKYTGELYTKLALKHSNIPYTIFRLFATYGSGQDLNNKHQGVLSIYLDQALKSNNIKITGSKHRVRELVHVDDVVDALIMSLDKNTDNQTFNVSNSEYLTPEIIIDKIGEAMKKYIGIREIDGYIGDQTYITSNTSKLNGLGWFPKYNLIKGIKEFLKNLK